MDARTREYIERVVDQCPPLTREQRSELALLLNRPAETERPAPDFGASGANALAEMMGSE